MDDATQTAFDTRFRILKVAGKRKAFRLEGVFWEFLQELADADRISLSKYFEKILAPAPNVNAAAFLRAHVAERALAILREHDALLQRANDLLLVANVPMFMLGETKKIIATNPAMQAFLTEHLGSAQVRIAFAADLDRVQADLEDGHTRIARVPCDIFASARQLRIWVVMVLIAAYGGRRRVLCTLTTNPSDAKSR